MIVESIARCIMCMAKWLECLILFSDADSLCTRCDHYFYCYTFWEQSCQRLQLTECVWIQMNLFHMALANGQGLVRQCFVAENGELNGFPNQEFFPLSLWASLFSSGPSRTLSLSPLSLSLSSPSPYIFLHLTFSLSFLTHCLSGRPFVILLLNVFNHFCV